MPITMGSYHDVWLPNDGCRTGWHEATQVVLEGSPSNLGNQHRKGQNKAAKPFKESYWLMPDQLVSHQPWRRPWASTDGRLELPGWIRRYELDVPTGAKQLILSLADLATCGRVSCMSKGAASMAMCCAETSGQPRLVALTRSPCRLS
jgi:hypothetical protein